jgi:carbon monoxide dehydrogenase subunit G
VRLENSFEVPASPEQTWELLNDVPRVVPCMPGAELTEVVDENTFKAKMHVKLGPIALQFATDVKREAADEAARKTTLSTKAREMKGRGGASATIESSLEPAGAGTRVTIVTDLQMQGAVAQYGRGVVPDVANQLVGQFAQNLASQLDRGGGEGGTPAEASGAAPASAPAPVKPVGGLGLILRALFRPLTGLIHHRR